LHKRNKKFERIIFLDLEWNEKTIIIDTNIHYILKNTMEKMGVFTKNRSDEMRNKMIEQATSAEKHYNGLVC